MDFLIGLLLVTYNRKGKLIMSGKLLVSIYKMCEWWVTPGGKGRCAQGTTWPKGNPPIIYAHFRVGKAIKDGYQRYLNTPPCLETSKLLYLGQRLHADGFKRGPKGEYKWLNDVTGFWIFSVYWELGKFAEEKCARFGKPMEALKRRHFTWETCYQPEKWLLSPTQHFFRQPLSIFHI